MARYTWNSITQDVPVGLNRVEFLRGDSRRVSLIVSANISTGIRVGSEPGSSSFGLYVTIESQSLRVLKFSDYGPAIKSPVWVSTSAGGVAAVTVTEILLLSQCG